MGDPRVQERDNPLVRRLNAVAQENERLGTALGGGARPPRAPLGPVQGGTATVLPPPAVPLTPEEALGDALPPAEAEELERRWALDPSNPANRAPNNEPTPAPVRQTAREYVAAHPEATGPMAGTISYPAIIDRLPITDEQKQTVRAWVFEGAAKQIMTETARRLDEMQIAFGLAPKEEGGALQEQGRSSEVVAPVASEQPGTTQSKSEGMAEKKPRKRSRTRKGSA